MRMKFAAAALIACWSVPASATGWQAQHGGAYAVPSKTNANIESILVLCVEGPVLNVYATGGVIKPASGADQIADYYYKPGFISAIVDDRDFPLVAAGSDDAAVLFSEGSLAENYLAPLHPDLVAALSAGKTLTLSFDLTPANAADGSVMETFAVFPLDGAAKPIAEALAPCL